MRYEEVFNIERPLKQALIKKTPTISFDDANCEGQFYLHDDALVVTILVANFTTRRILIDSSSSVDILFWDTFVKMGIIQD